jgi:hypothetical protein
MAGDELLVILVAAADVGGDLWTGAAAAGTELL